MEARDIRDAYTFTMDFMREQNAYVPNLTETKGLIAGQRKSLCFEGLIPDEMERMDYLAQ